MSVTTSAPGKMVLLGEYAVLEGAPAICTAVNRRATATTRMIPSTEIRVHTRGHAAAPARLRPQRRGWKWLDAGAAARLPLVDQVLRRALKGVPRGQPGCGFRLDLDTEAFFSGGAGPRRKLGLGSSAALTVACASAVAAHVEHRDHAGDRAKMLEPMLQIHREFQNGQGSGADIATSLLGGTLVYRRQSSVTQAQTFAAPWPAPLAYRFIWTGRATSTTHMLERLSDWAERHPRPYQASMQRLCAIAEAGASALIASDGAALLDPLRHYAEALRELDAQAGLGIVSDEHQHLAHLADRQGAIYKSCGAGGGDFGVALSLDEDRLIRFSAVAADQGFVPVALRVDEPGLRCHFNPSEEEP